MNAYMARQAIFNQHRQTVGYELLFRDGSGGNKAHVTDNNAATRKVVTDAVTLFGLDNLTGGRYAYINFTSRLILDGFVRLTDPSKVVVQVMGNAVMNDDMETALRALRDDDYFLVLKNYLGQDHYRPYLSLFDVIRVNFRKTNFVFQRSAVRKYGTPETVFMADRIETKEEFESALNMGYQLFQGYYFNTPDMLSIPILPLMETAYGKILAALLVVSPDVRWERQCADIIQSHLLLAYLFPREMATVPTPTGKKPEHYTPPKDWSPTIYRMGPHWVRRWTCLAFLRHNNTSGDDQLPRDAYRRALFMDAIAAKSELNVDVQSGNVFLLGILSMLEEIAGEGPLYLLRGFPLPPELRGVLMENADNDYAALLRYARLYETRPNGRLEPDFPVSLDKYKIEDAFKACMEETEAAIEIMDTPIKS